MPQYNGSSARNLVQLQHAGRLSRDSHVDKVSTILRIGCSNSKGFNAGLCWREISKDLVPLSEACYVVRSWFIKFEKPSPLQCSPSLPFKHVTFLRLTAKPQCLQPWNWLISVGCGISNCAFIAYYFNRWFVAYSTGYRKSFCCALKEKSSSNRYIRALLLRFKRISFESFWCLDVVIFTWRDIILQQHPLERYYRKERLTKA